MTDLDAALRMLDTFASVGATHFDLTHTNIDGEKAGIPPEPITIAAEELNAEAVSWRNRTAEQHHHAPDKRQGPFRAA